MAGAYYAKSTSFTYDLRDSDRLEDLYIRIWEEIARIPHFHQPLNGPYKLLPGHYVNLVDLSDDGRVVRLYFRRDNLYVIGSSRNDGNGGDEHGSIWEVVDPNTRARVLYRSHNIGLFTYEADLEEEKISYQTVLNAHRILHSREGGDRTQKKALQVFFQMIGEGIRFKWMSDRFVRVFRNPACHINVGVVMELYHHWAIYSNYSRFVDEGEDYPIDIREECNRRFGLREMDLFSRGQLARVVCVSAEKVIKAKNLVFSDFIEDRIVFKRKHISNYIWIDRRKNKKRKHEDRREMDDEDRWEMDDRKSERYRH